MKPTRPARRWIAAAAAIALALASLALDPVRAAADQLLQIFRVQNVVFVPVSSERMSQLEQLNFDGTTLFTAEPTFTGDQSEPRVVASREEAAAAVGFTLAEPATLPIQPTEATYSVTAPATAEFQVNVESARELLRLTGVTDVELPDALGEGPVVVELAPMALTRYSGEGFTVDLAQGTAPQVSLPDGVSLSDLGRAALRLLGMTPEQADALSSQIDWSSTLIFPFPADLSSVRQVSINGAPGLVMTGGGRGSGSAQIYWQRGSQFYVLSIEGQEGSDTLTQLLVQTAESVR